MVAAEKKVLLPTFALPTRPAIPVKMPHFNMGVHKHKFFELCLNGLSDKSRGIFFSRNFQAPLFLVVV
jgi:hypothetical protein